MKNFIAYFLIGGSDVNAANRNIGWHIKDIKWQGFIDTWIKPAIDIGITRFEIHNPGGVLFNENMQADEFAEAAEAGIGWISKDFVKAWRPITAKYEVISYLGTFYQNAQFVNAAEGKWTKDDYVKRLYDSYALPLDAGMSIGFDAISQTSNTAPEYHFMRMLNGLGVKTYIEPWQHVAFPWFNNDATVTTSQLYDLVKAGTTWAAKPEDITGEKIIMLNASPAGETWTTYPKWGPGWVKGIQAAGMTAMISPSDIIASRTPLEKWLAKD